MSTLIKNVILNGKIKDILIEGNKIKKIGKINVGADQKIDGKKERAVLPGLVNCHTHAAMTLFRGYGDDLPLKIWLEKKIWPLEAKLTENDVYWGSKLACLEMIKTGTVAFSDMYWFPEAEMKAVEEMGIRGLIGLTMIDFDKKGKKENIKAFYGKLRKKETERVKLALSPHAIYTVSKENLIWAKKFAKENNLVVHIHISETEREVEDCKKSYKMRPVEYLDKIGFLGDNVVLAHGVWLSDKEIKVLAKRKCSVSYNPCSNLKLAVGGIFPFKKLKEARVNICFGTDGVASNNNLDLFEEMKVGALIQKYRENNPTVAKAKEIFDAATKNGAKALKINAGEIKEGKLADMILVATDKTFFTPGHDLFSDIVYSGTGSVVTDTICNGRILMRDRKVKDEDKIIKKATAIAKKLVS